MSRKHSEAKVNRKCKCKLKTVLEYLIAVPGCSGDLAAVSSLPEEWTPGHGGPTLSKYLEQRENNHKEVLTNIKKEADIVNNEIDSKVRDIAEILLADIRKHKQDIECYVKESEPDSGVLSVEKRNECYKKITQVFSVWTQALANFKGEALAFERERIEGIKTVLKKHFQILVKVGHKSPKDLLHEFDGRMYVINQQLISNCRAYTELEAQLRSQADAYIVRSRSSLNEFCLEKASFLRGRSALPWMNETQRKRSSSLETKLKKSSDAIPSSQNMEGFKDYISQLVKAYRSAVLQLCADFSGQLNNLQEDFDRYAFLEKPRVSVLSRIQKTVDRAFRKFSDTFSQSKVRVEKVLLDITFNDVVHMQKSLCHFGDRLQSTYLILHDAGYLWDGHMLRSALVQKLMMTGVEDMMTSHDAVELANEVAFNIGLEQLRAAPDLDKLQQQFDLLSSMLDRFEEIYHQHKELEVKKLEEYMNLPSIMSNIMLAEYECFFEKYPKCPLNSNQSLNSSPDLVSPRRQTLISLRAPLPRVVLQTHLQDVALYNWRNGFLESLQNNAPSVTDNINWQARRWVDEHTMQVNMRYSLKLMSHSVRLERLKAAREVRSNELKYHERVITSHLNAMNDLIDSLPMEIAEHLSLDSPQLYPLPYWVNKIQLDMDQMIASDPDPETKRLKMSSYAPRLVMFRRLFEESLDVAMEEYKKNIQQRLQTVRLSTFQLISQIKFPTEGGTHVPSEATKSMSAILKMCDAFELCANKSVDMVNHRRQQLILMADQLLHPLTRSVEDVFKTTDKKKPTMPTKKK
ncbi:unnamed protein product [Leptosia nina]|uniref:DUF4455 domain-containing protein n=1 Tax=Leptosia nina TaxID=320188 RepID=A0AAV1J249_9NEOP